MKIGLIFGGNAGIIILQSQLKNILDKIRVKKMMLREWNVYENKKCC